jgi:uncharacterized protein
MRILIAGGTGLIGKSLINHWHNKHDIYILGRNIKKLKKLFPQHHCITWNRLKELNPHDIDVVINLAGESINHLFWTAAIKEKILQSRITATKTLVQWVNQHPTAQLHFLNASALSIYGLYSDLPCVLADEQSTITKHDELLSQVAWEWEAAASQLSSHNALTILRFAVVLGQTGGALPKLKFIAQCGLAAKMGSGTQPFAWIALDDLVCAIDWVIAKKIIGAINFVAPTIPTQDQLSDILSRALSRPYFLTCPASLLTLSLGQMATELLLKGQAASPKALLTSGYPFLYSDFNQYITALKTVKY